MKLSTFTNALNWFGGNTTTEEKKVQTTYKDITHVNNTQYGVSIIKTKDFVETKRDGVSTVLYKGASIQEEYEPDQKFYDAEGEVGEDFESIEKLDLIEDKKAKKSDKSNDTTAIIGKLLTDRVTEIAVNKVTNWITKANDKLEKELEASKGMLEANKSDKDSHSLNQSFTEYSVKNNVKSTMFNEAISTIFSRIQPLINSDKLKSLINSDKFEPIADKTSQNLNLKSEINKVKQQVGLEAKGGYSGLIFGTNNAKFNLNNKITIEDKHVKPISNNTLELNQDDCVFQEDFVLVGEEAASSA